MVKPTVIGFGTPQAIKPVLAASAAQPVMAAVSISQNFPIALSDEQFSSVSSKLASANIVTIPLREIATLGSEAEDALHRTLDGFLGRIDEFDNPKLFQLIGRLSEAVDQEKLPELADQILNGKQGIVQKIGLFLKSRKAQEASVQKAWEETKRLASGKTKTLVAIVNTMDQELKTEQRKLDGEIQSMEQLKNAYRERFSDFVVAVAFLSAFLEQAKVQVAQVMQNADPNNPTQKMEIDELQDKLQALESRALAMEGTLSRLPADQLVLRQLQNAGIQTLQETATTASSRFASIKMTLLTLHGALMVKGVQKLAEQGAALDANLSAVRGKLMQDVVTTAAKAPGENRMQQAQQLQAIVQDTKLLLTIVENARTANSIEFNQVRDIFTNARMEMLGLGQQLRPGQAINY